MLGTSKKMIIKSKKIDLVIITNSVIVAIIGVFYFIELSTNNNSEEIDLFRSYTTNRGIVTISVIQFCLAVLAIVILLKKILSKKNNQFQTVALIIITIGLGLTPWIEMWYGSTFYYGEVRDKQGLGFPFLSLIFLLYPIWIFREETNRITQKQFSARIIATLSLIIISVIFYNQILEPWKIWQS